MAKKRNREPLTEEEKRTLNSESFKKLKGIFRFTLPYKGYFIAGLTCLIVSSFFLLSFPLVFKQLLDIASGGNNPYINSIHQAGFILLGILLVQSIFSFFRVYLFAQVSERAMADVRLTLYKKLMSLSIPFYDSRRTGELISRLTSDVTMLQDTFSITLAEFIRQTVSLIGGITIIFIFMPGLSVFMLATFPFIVIITFFFGRFIRKMSKKTQDELAAANVIAEETLQSISIVKAFTSEWFEISRYGRSLNKVIKVALKTASFRGAFISFIIFALFGGMIAIVWYGAILVQNGEMTIGGLTAFIMYTAFIGGSIAGLGDLYGQVQKAIGSSERILEIIDHEGEYDLDKEWSSEKLPVQGKIDFVNVGFSYPSRADVKVLQDINLTINPGEKIALVGHSGAGKSTIIQLLMRFYPLQHGHILMDDIDINTYDLAQYRRNLGIVPQEVILFGGSIGENISYGKPGATLDEIRDAAKKANALPFIDSFPDGMETIVGERGIKLSGGQRQRIAIARAILKDPAILILDEATSSLDAESEMLVQEALDELMKNRTTIIIAHRLATIRKVDRIYVVNEGKISENGSHEELLKVEDGTYKNLVKLQLELKD